MEGGRADAVDSSRAIRICPRYLSRFTPLSVFLSPLLFRLSLSFLFYTTLLLLFKIIKGLFMGKFFFLKKRLKVGFYIYFLGFKVNCFLVACFYKLTSYNFSWIWHSTARFNCSLLDSIHKIFKF